MSDYVPLRDLAAELGVDRSGLRKWVLRQDVEIVRVRTAASKGQKTLAVSVEDADALRALRDSEGFGVSVNPTPDGGGFLYVVVPFPECAPRRVKLGFATDTDTRLAAYRTIAPTAQVVKAWSCHRTWETAATASITRMDCSLVGGEVFDCDDLDALVQRGDEFFAMMPREEQGHVAERAASGG